MSTPTFNESAHPRSRSGKWTAKTVDEAFAGMDALSVSTQGAPTAGGTQTQVGVKESAAAMRHDLRAKFDHPFSVKMSRGTGYGWVHVDWNDGPRATPVTAMTILAPIVDWARVLRRPGRFASVMRVSG